MGAACHGLAQAFPGTCEADGERAGLLMLSDMVNHELSSITHNSVVFSLSLLSIFPFLFLLDMCFCLPVHAAASHQLHLLSAEPDPGVQSATSLQQSQLPQPDSHATPAARPPKAEHSHNGAEVTMDFMAAAAAAVQPAVPDAQPLAGLLKPPAAAVKDATSAETVSESLPTKQSTAVRLPTAAVTGSEPGEVQTELPKTAAEATAEPPALPAQPAVATKSPSEDNPEAQGEVGEGSIQQALGQGRAAGNATALAQAGSEGRLLCT